MKNNFSLKSKLKKRMEEEELPAQSLYEIVKECEKLAKELHGHKQKEKKEYFRNLLKERYYRRVEDVFPVEKKQKVDEVKCPGCLIDAPSQIDHQGSGGCLNFSPSSSLQ